MKHTENTITRKYEISYGICRPPIYYPSLQENYELHGDFSGNRYENLQENKFLANFHTNSHENFHVIYNFFCSEVRSICSET